MSCNACSIMFTKYIRGSMTTKGEERQANNSNQGNTIRQANK